MLATIYGKGLGADGWEMIHGVHGLRMARTGMID